MSDQDVLLYVCSVFSASVIFLSAFSKLFQISNVLASGSSQGISLGSIALELIALSILLTYQLAMDYPMQSYFENVLLVPQDFLLSVVVMGNRKQIDWRLVPFFLLYASGFIIMSLRMLPDLLMMAAIYVCMVILNLSKWYQLTTILESKYSGQVSAATWIISTYNTAVRILTTIVITKDIPVFICLFTNQVLNVAVIDAIYYYRESPRRASV